jgi:hypothetical protein
MPADEHRLMEADRLWRAVKRDALFIVEGCSGAIRRPGQTSEQATDELNARSRRFDRNWRALCDVNLNLATVLVHGFEELYLQVNRADPRTAECRDQMWSDAIAEVEFARAANPDAEVETIGELLALGDQALRNVVDDEGHEAS